MINALDAPAEAAWAELHAAQDAAAAVPARIRLGELAPDMVRLEAEVKQITHAIRMAAYNAETPLARALDGHYARASDEAYALIREALTLSGDIRPGNGELLIRLDPLTAPGGPRHSPPSATSSTRPQAATPAPISSCATRSNPTLALHELPLYVRSPEPRLAVGHQPVRPCRNRHRERSLRTPAISDIADKALGPASCALSLIMPNACRCVRRAGRRRRS